MSEYTAIPELGPVADKLVPVAARRGIRGLWHAESSRLYIANTVAQSDASFGDLEPALNAAVFSIYNRELSACQSPRMLRRAANGTSLSATGPSSGIAVYSFIGYSGPFAAVHDELRARFGHAKDRE